MSFACARVGRSWLALREPADAAARSRELVARLRPHLPVTGEHVIHDLGAGTGAMGRWLAPQLPGPQRWVLHDRDPELLEAAVADAPDPADGGAAVTVEARRSDVTSLAAGALAGASLVTASALLDMLRADELAALLGACAGAGCPILLALSVVGRVELVPAHPLDRRLAQAFDDHQRRTTPRGPLLGPDAAGLARQELERQGLEVLVRPSPWRLGPSHVELAAEWLTGWVGAACEQQPDLAADGERYASLRLEQVRAGRLAVTVEHVDLLALPPPGRCVALPQSSGNRRESA